MNIKTLPKSERPYEKLEINGPEKLSNAELLAILIKNGTKEKTAIQIAQELLSMGEKRKTNSLKFLNEITLDELKDIKGIGRVKAIEIKAICELVRRMSMPIDLSIEKIKSPSKAAELLMDEMRFEKIEIVKVVLLNTKNNVLKITEVARGKANSASVEPKEIFSDALKYGAPKIILIHNHPSGDPNPSREDILLTERIERAGELMGIELVDHIVIGDGIYKSIFSERKRAIL